MVFGRYYNRGMEMLKQKMSVQPLKIEDLNPGSPIEKTGLMMSFAIDFCYI